MTAVKKIKELSWLNRSQLPTDGLSMSAISKATSGVRPLSKTQRLILAKRLREISNEAKELSILIKQEKA